MRKEIPPMKTVASMYPDSQPPWSMSFCCVDDVMAYPPQLSAFFASLGGPHTALSSGQNDVQSNRTNLQSRHSALLLPA
jgi:hypothetical protein